MIKKLTQSLLDKKYLELRSPIAHTASVDFSTLAVNKPWGNEYLMISTPQVETWSLFIGHNKATSMHCHPRKKTALVVLEGNALFSSLNESMELSALDAVMIEPGVFHSTQGLSKTGVRVLEFETPPMKHDLIRLEDKYGRVNEGYEGADKAFQILATHTRFHSSEHNIHKNLGQSRLCLHSLNHSAELRNLQHGPRTLLAIMNGQVLSRNDEQLWGPSDIVSLEELTSNGYADYNFNQLQILSIANHF
ncbi:MAG: hypothetical protein Q7S32_00770 [bacterium]|nr:hypothetical protein [bacterium]